MNATGSTIMIQRCVLSIVADMKYVDEIWLAAYSAQMGFYTRENFERKYSANPPAIQR